MIVCKKKKKTTIKKQLMRSRSQFKKYARLYLCLFLRNLSVTVRLGEGVREMYKKGDRKANFCYLKEKSVDISYKQNNQLPQSNLFQEK